MVLLTMAGVTIASLIALGYPLLKNKRDAEDPEETDELAHRKASIYQDIRDLEFDRETDKVAQADYEAMRTDYETEAALVLEVMDQKGNGHAEASCPGCGKISEPGARFCPSCGCEMDHRCPSCGEQVAEDDRFCGACGGEIPASRA